MPWTGWQHSHGLDGNIPMDCVATFPWTGWQKSVEYADTSDMINIGPSHEFHGGQCGLDHGVGHPLLLLYDVKAPNGQNNNEFKALYHYPSVSL
jgi:hypothetical protein